MKRSFYPTLFISLLLSSCAAKPIIAQADEAPQDRFGLKTSSEKRVDNKGEGYERLYGTRNFRSVLANVLYRGGANNKNNRYGTRSNKNPLPDQGLKSLCEQGFDTAVYMYSDGFETAPKKVECTEKKSGLPSTLDYLQMGPYKETSIRELLEITARKIRAGGAIKSSYYHCWNGWHASGMISAYSLRQFCDYTGDQAVQYWDLNTDGNNTDPVFQKLRTQIREFKPYEDLKLTPAEHAKFCLPMK